MKTLIIELQNEMGAIMHELKRLEEVTEKQKTFTRNEAEIKRLLSSRIGTMVQAGEVMTVLLNKLGRLNDYDLAHGSDVERLES